MYKNLEEFVRGPLHKESPSTVSTEDIQGTAKVLLHDLALAF